MPTDLRAAGLPGEPLVEAGLRDLAMGRETIEALLVAIGAPRLRRLGVSVPDAAALSGTPELRLYDLLSRDFGLDAHARYNALVRRLVSFERSLELRTRLARDAGEPCSS